jgi:ferredoxin
VFTLNGTYRGKALNQARVLLARTGLTEVGAFGCYGEGRFIGYTRLGYEFSTGHPTSTELESAQRFGAEVIRAHRAASGGGPAPTPHSRDPRTHVVYAVERAVTGPWLARSLYSRLFRADTAQCTRCGRCVKACPTGNITLERGELPKWGGDCVICGTCALVCPESAVRCPYDWPVFTPFMRYNTRRAARDPGLEHSRVVWRRGEIIRED